MININWPIEKEKLRKMPIGEPFICMFSGGKDSGLALSMTINKGKPIALVHYIDENSKESIFHKQKCEIIEAQATALNLPVVYQYNKWWVKWNKIVKMYMEYKKQGVKYVVFGDLVSEDNAKTQVTLCQSAGLIPCMPLWLLPYEILLDEIKERNIKSIITIINDPLIESKWLGKVFDRQAYECFKELGIDPFGENGEFHTTLVDADCFKSPLNYKIIANDSKKIVITVKA